jgi:hypothetical protein
MGTRNLTMVVKGGEYKVAQYCQWDGYPSGQGATVLTFLRDEMNRPAFEAAVSATREITEAELKERWEDCGATRDDGMVSIEESDRFKKRYPWLHRDCGADVLKIIQESGGDIALNLTLDFVKDSLFCEWAYVVDLDQNTLEVYVGFNQKPLAEGDRFFSGETPEKEYWPVRLAKSYPLDALPTDDEFQTDLAQDDEEEEEAVIKFYKVTGRCTLTVIDDQGRDTEQFIPDLGTRIKVDHDTETIYVMDLKDNWVETIDRVSDALLGQFELVPAEEA